MKLAAQDDANGGLVYVGLSDESNLTGYMSQYIAKTENTLRISQLELGTPETIAFLWWQMGS